MAIELYWDNDERDVMLIEVEGAWGWEELWDVLRKIKKVTDSSPYVIGALLDVSRGTSIPGGTIFNQTALNHAKEMLKLGEGGTGPIAIVGANSLIRMVFTSFQNLDRKALSNVQFAANHAQARQMLHEALRESRTARAQA